MKALLQITFLGTLLVSAVSSVGSALAAAKIFTQGPCGPNVCLTFDHDDTIPVIRSFGFAAPSAGKAQVAFHGAVYCGSTIIADTAVHLEGQIVTGAGATPAEDGPGGLLLAMVLKDEGEHALDSSDTMSLAATRVITYPSGGNKVVFFKIARLAMEEGTTCHVYNASFSVVFIP